MDDATKNMLLTVGAGILKKAGIAFGTTLATHGFIAGNYVEAFGALAVAGGSAGYSLWQDYGKAILLSQLEVLKARSLAAADKIQKAGLKPVTTEEIAAQSPTLTSTQVTNIAATLPAEVHASVVPMKAAS
jgi:hypothetical protein